MGAVSSVYRVGSMKATRQPSAEPACCTGTVIAIFSLVGVCATGAVIAIFDRLWLPPAM